MNENDYDYDEDMEIEYLEGRMYNNKRRLTKNI